MAKKRVIRVRLYKNNEFWTWFVTTDMDGISLGHCGKSWQRRNSAARHARRWFRKHMDCEIRIVG